MNSKNIEKNCKEVAFARRYYLTEKQVRDNGAIVQDGPKVVFSLVFLYWSDGFFQGVLSKLRYILIVLDSPK